MSYTLSLYKKLLTIVVDASVYLEEYASMIAEEGNTLLN